MAMLKSTTSLMTQLRAAVVAQERSEFRPRESGERYGEPCDPKGRKIAVGREFITSRRAFRVSRDIWKRQRANRIDAPELTTKTNLPKQAMLTFGVQMRTSESISSLAQNL